MMMEKVKTTPLIHTSAVAITSKTQTWSRKNTSHYRTVEVKSVTSGSILVKLAKLVRNTYGCKTLPAIFFLFLFQPWVVSILYIETQATFSTWKNQSLDIPSHFKPTLFKASKNEQSKMNTETTLSIHGTTTSFTANSFSRSSGA